MKTPKMQGPTAEETALKQAQAEDIAKRNKQLDEQEMARKAEEAATAASAQAGRVGRSSLLSGDWNGFSRGGDLTAR